MGLTSFLWEYGLHEVGYGRQKKTKQKQTKKDCEVFVVALQRVGKFHVHFWKVSEKLHCTQINQAKAVANVSSFWV